MAAGMTLGPLMSGLLAEATPWPTTSPYVLDIVLAAILATASLRIAETRPTAITTPAHVPALHVPAEIRPAFALPASAGAATFMVTGWVFGLSPSFLHEELNVHLTRPLVAGLLPRSSCSPPAPHNSCFAATTAVGPQPSRCSPSLSVWE